MSKKSKTTDAYIAARSVGRAHAEAEAARARAEAAEARLAALSAATAPAAPPPPALAAPPPPASLREQLHAIRARSRTDAAAFALQNGAAILAEIEKAESK